MLFLIVVSIQVGFDSGTWTAAALWPSVKTAPLAGKNSLLEKLRRQANARPEVVQEEGQPPKPHELQQEEPTQEESPLAEVPAS